MEPSALTEAQKQELIGFVQGLNENLRTSSASGAELAFGLGCGLGLIPVVGIIVSLVVLEIISLIPGLLLLIIALVGLVGVAMLLANVARSNAQKRIFHTDLEPEIARFISSQKLTRQEFDTLACQTLPPDAPLQAFLSPVFEDDLEQTEQIN